MPEESMSQLQQIWEAQASADPLWAILSEDSKRRRGWDLPSFLATGEQFVGEVLDRFGHLGWEPHGAALDFGCGVGRLTQPLAQRFDRVIGVDISPTMIEGAERLNRFGERVTYVVNAQPDLSFVPSASLDFVMSFITLQHIPPDATCAYLAEFVRILRPGGVLFFQLPSHRNTELVESTSHALPVAPDSCQAHIAAREIPATALAHDTIKIEVAVRNDSADTWVSIPEHPLRVANRWLDESGTPVIHDDGRRGLPSRIEPDATATVSLTVTAPARPGSYGLALDVVQEGIRWFADVGNPPVVVPIQVLPRPTADGPGSEAVVSGDDVLDGIIADEWREPPSFSMHGIERSDVEQMLSEWGASILATDEHIDDWVSFGYYVVVS